MVGAVGQGGYPLAVPLGLLFPGETQREINPSDQESGSAPSDSTHVHGHYYAPGRLQAPVEGIWAFLTPWDSSWHLEVPT